jgi:hypothetical protein
MSEARNQSGATMIGVIACAGTEGHIDSTDGFDIIIRSGRVSVCNAVRDRK